MSKIDVEKLKAVAPHICWGEVGCDKHFCSLDKGHIGRKCFSLHLSPCNIGEKDEKNME